MNFTTALGKVFYDSDVSLVLAHFWFLHEVAYVPPGLCDKKYLSPRGIGLILVGDPFILSNFRPNSKIL